MKLGPKIAEGWTAEIFRVDETRVLKLYREPFAFVRDREFRKMKLLEDRFEAVPRVFDTVDIEGRLGYTMEHIDGRSLRDIGETAQTPEEIVEPIFALHRRLREIPAPAEFEVLSERLAGWMDSRPIANEQVKEAALELLRGLDPGDGLCHGDFHAGNILLTRKGAYLVDWNGAGRGDLHAELAKTLLLLRYAPPGLALRGRGYEMRAQICRQYLSCFADRDRLDEALLGRWLIVRFAEFLTFGIPEFQQSLEPLIRAWFSGAEPDCGELLAL